MADTRLALSENAEGEFFVDSSCFNCGASRHFAPEIFGDTGRHAFVKRQPVSPAETEAARRALLACPTASIGSRGQRSGAARASRSSDPDLFPLQLAEDVFVNGYNHRSSFGAHSYFIRSPDGNWLVDSPRFVSRLVRKFEEQGGLRYIFLSHRDDVGDAAKFARHFGAERIIHRLDSDAQPDAERILESEGDQVERIGEAEIYFTPGHTRGHHVLLWRKRYLFTGDHFAWLPARDRFGSFRDACWFDWETQIESVRRMRDFQEVEWVFPGHGRWGPVRSGEFPEIVDRAVADMIAAR